MIVKVENISKGAEFDDAIWDYWVTLKLSDETILNIFDSNCLSSNFRINSLLFVKLKALFVQTKKEKGLMTLKGIVLKRDVNYLFNNDLIEIKINGDDIDDEKIPINTPVTLFFGRIDLLDFSLQSL